MNIPIQPATEEEAAELFRSQNDFGDKASAWLRPFRQLFNEGKPVGALTALLVPIGNGLSGHIGTLNETGGNRLVFWPVFPLGTETRVAGTIVDAFDHITVEFPSERFHITAYDHAGNPVHSPKQGWRMRHLPDAPFAWWFTLRIKRRVIAEQDWAVQRRIQAPASDKERRMAAFVRSAREMKPVPITIPASTECGDYYHFAFLVLTEPPSQNEAPVSISIPVLTDDVDGCPDRPDVELEQTSVRVGSKLVVVVACTPPGALRSDVDFAFPHNRRQNRR